MNRVLKTLISLSNLTKAKSVGGQISTLLILMLSIGLILVLATVNIGNMAMDSTKLSNAADSAALLLGSNLATRAKMVSEGLAKSSGSKDHDANGNVTKVCQKRNFLSAIIALVAAVIAVFFCQPCLVAIAQVYAAMGIAASAMAVSMTVGAIAGAAGGVLGAVITGTDIGQGALTGAIVGVAVGAAGAGSAASGTSAAGEGGGAVTASGTAAGDGVAITAGADGAVSAGAISAGAVVPAGTTVIIPAATFTLGTAAGALATASAVYNEGQKWNYVAEAQEALTRALSKLSERDRFRESAFYTALTQIVDDPEWESDVDDMDADGDTTELLPRFYIRWHRRLLDYKRDVDAQRPIIEQMLRDMAVFRDFLAGTVNGTTRTETVYIDPVTNGPCTGMSWDCVAQEKVVPVPGLMERQDYKWTLAMTADNTDAQQVAVEGAAEGVVDANIAEYLRGLYGAGYVTPYWEPGPGAAAMNDWADDEDCDTFEPSTCASPPAGYDDFDNLAEDFRYWVDVMDRVSPPPTFEQFLAQHYPSPTSDSADYMYYGWRYNMLQEQYRAAYDQMVAESEPVSDWGSWVYDFYDPDMDPIDPMSDTYYGELGRQIQLLEDLKASLQGILPNCNEGNYDETDPTVCGSCGGCVCPGNECYLADGTQGCWEWILNGGFYLWCSLCCGECVFNPPCSFRNSTSHPQDTVTIDTNSDDEWLPVLNDLNRLIGELQSFRQKLGAFGQAIFGEPGTHLLDCGSNCVRYQWDDSRGQGLYVMVQSNNFKLAKTKTSKSFSKVCTKLRDYDLECWIKVTRSDPSKEIGALGRWNPFRRSVAKVSRVDYGLDKVRMSGTSR